MKTKHIIVVLLCLLMGMNAEAQLFKKLKEKVLGSESTEATASGNNPALLINTEAKKFFFKEDVVIEMYEDNVKTQTQYFDQDQVAIRMESDNIPKPGYTDSEGLIYTFDENKGQYTKTAMMALPGQDMMIPMTMLNAYKLPPEPFMANLQKQEDLGLKPNPFNGIVEFAFIYKPENFRYEDYKESKIKINGKTYTKFDILNEPGYEGSYVIFDHKDRLVEFYTKSTAAEANMETMEMERKDGDIRFKYTYKPVEVELPDAEEANMMGQGMLGSIMGGNKKKGKKPEDLDEDDYDTSDSKGRTKSIQNTLKNNKVTKKTLPESYDFDYLYKTEMTIVEKKKTTTMDMNFLLNTKNPSYSGSEYVNEEISKLGRMITVFDSNLKAMIMFTKGKGNQNMLQITPIPKPRKNKKQDKFKITELPSKTILGRTCTGLQLESEKYIITSYHAQNASVVLSNFLGSGISDMSKELNLPDMDPRIINQFENSLVMEVQYEDKKKQKNSFSIKAKSLEKVTTQIKKGDYQALNILSGFKMFGN